MKLSLRGAGVLVLSLTAAAIGTAACADSEQEPFIAPPNDTGDASLPDDTDGAVTPDASAEAGATLCSVHGFCRTALPPGQHTLEGVWGDGTGVVWAVTAEGSLLRWDGKAWKVHASDLGPLVAVWGSGPTDVWIGGDAGLRHGTGTSSATLSFAEVALGGEPTRIASIWGLPATGEVWAAGSADDPDTKMSVARLLHLANGGAGWTEITLAPEMSSCSGVWGNAATGVWAACSRPVVDLPEYSELVILRKHGGDDFVEVPMPVNPDDDPLLSIPGVLGGAVAISDSSVWIYGATATTWPTVWQGTSTDNGATFTFTEQRDGKPNDPAIMAVHGTAPNDVWAVGEYGKARHWNGTTWSTVAITNKQVPIIDPLHAVWSGGQSEVWFVGKQIALRFDPTQEKDGGVQ